MGAHEAPFLEAPPPPRLEPGCHAVKVERFGFLRQKFVSSASDQNRLRVHYFTRDGKPGLFAKAWFGAGAEGPPGHAHGGSIAALLDDVMGATGWLTDMPIVAARLTVNYRRMLPLGTDATAHAVIERVEGRKVYVAGRLVDPGTGEPFAEAEGLFIKLQGEKLAQLQELRRHASEGGPGDAP